MTLPSWNPVAVIKVESKPAGLWTIAMEYVPPSRLLRFRVVDKDGLKKTVSTDWKLGDDPGCGADGVASSATKAGLLCSAAPQGALIAKIGGSTADVPDSSSPGTSPYAGKRVFPVGSFCIVTVASVTDAGPLFLTINDVPDGFKTHSGALHVEISEAPI
jgi:hypothetical protein